MKGKVADVVVGIALQAPPGDVIVQLRPRRDITVDNIRNSQPAKSVEQRLHCPFVAEVIGPLSLEAEDAWPTAHSRSLSGMGAPRPMNRARHRGTKPPSGSD